MSPSLDSTLFTSDHLWIMVEDSLATIGITDHGVHLLGDVALVELPEDDTDLVAGDQVASVQGRNDDMDFPSPVSGKVVEVNLELAETPELLNQDPHGVGWLVRIEMTDESELEALMSEKEYDAFLDRDEED